MATIKISNLHQTGGELFHDSESYLNEITDDEMNLTVGGGTWYWKAVSFVTKITPRLIA